MVDQAMQQGMTGPGERPQDGTWAPGRVFGPKMKDLTEIVAGHAEQRPDLVLLRRRDRAQWRDVTARDFAEEVVAVAKGLVASGVGPGDRVALMSKTRYEWTLCDFAIWFAGAVTVPVYETSSPDQLGWILSDSGAVAAFAETRSHGRHVDEVAPQLREAGRRWSLEPDATTPGLDELVGLGRDVPDAEIAARRAGLSRESLATLIYTSGTTGRPKGCRLTHGNFLVECEAAVSALPEVFEAEGASTLLFLPIAHVFGRMIEVAVLLAGVPMGHSDTGRLAKDLATFQPTFVLSVPRVFEKVFDTARRKAEAAGRARIFDAATATAIAYSTALERGGPGPLLRIRHAAFERLVYGKLRAALGGRAEFAISGGAPLGARLGHFFRGAGVRVLEGYGLTETTAACTVNNREGTRIGTVGRALPGTQVRIAPDGEVQVRGGHVFSGYWGAAGEESAGERDGSFTADGWLRTGDLGTLDADGFLTITGRRKEILVTSAGKNVAPAGLEDRIRAHPLVSQCVVVGDGRPHVAALVTLDAEAVAAWLNARGRAPVPVADLVDDPQVLDEVQGAVTAANTSVSDAEAVRRFRILPVDLTEEGGQLTPTMKIKRAVVAQEFSADIEQLYAPGGGRAAR